MASPIQRNRCPSCHSGRLTKEAEKSEWDRDNPSATTESKSKSCVNFSFNDFNCIFSFLQYNIHINSNVSMRRNLINRNKKYRPTIHGATTRSAKFSTFQKDHQIVHLSSILLNLHRHRTHFVEHFDVFFEK